MKSAGQLFLGLLTAIGSTLLVLAAASLALLEGGAEVGTPTQTPVIQTTVVSSPVPLRTTSPIAETTVAPTITPTAARICQDTPKDWVAYTVQPGDTIDSLAQQSGVSTEEFLKANCFVSAAMRLEPGWVVYLPPTAPTATATETETPTPAPALPTPIPCAGPPRGWIIYIVRPGDNLYRVSLAYGLSQQELITANCLQSVYLYAGQRLYVPNRPTLTPVVTDTPIPPDTETPVPPTETETPTATPTTPTPKTKKDQTINFPAPADKVYGEAPFAVSATASSGLPVSLSVTGSCTIAGNTITLTGAGSCTVTASQDGDSTYNPAAPVAHTFQIAKANQTISLQAPSSKIYGDPDFSVSATATSGLPVNLTASGNCTLSGTTVSLTGAGSCTLTASQDGDASYNAAATVTHTVTINKAGQTIDFVGPPDKTFGDPPFSVSATATSGLPVTFNASGNCTVAGSVVTLTSAGQCTLTATQNGDGNTNAAAPVTRSFQIK